MIVRILNNLISTASVRYYRMSQATDNSSSGGLATLTNLVYPSWNCGVFTLKNNN